MVKGLLGVQERMRLCPALSHRHVPPESPFQSAVGSCPWDGRQPCCYPRCYSTQPCSHMKLQLAYCNFRKKCFWILPQNVLLKAVLHRKNYRINDLVL